MICNIIFGEMTWICFDSSVYCNIYIVSDCAYMSKWASNNIVIGL